jgi:hypothetical protein
LSANFFSEKIMSSNKDEVKGRSEDAISRAKEGVERGAGNKDVEVKGGSSQKNTGTSQPSTGGARHDTAKTVKRP